MIVIHELTPLEVMESRFDDWGHNHALIAGLHALCSCPKCGKLIFSYDPEDERYVKCSCGERKRVPASWEGVWYTRANPDWWVELLQVEDGFKLLFNGTQEEK